jgi:hypothetical protein
MNRSSQIPDKTFVPFAYAILCAALALPDPALAIPIKGELAQANKLSLVTSNASAGRKIR